MRKVAGLALLTACLTVVAGLDAPPAGAVPATVTGTVLLETETGEVVPLGDVGYIYIQVHQAGNPVQSDGRMALADGSFSLQLEPGRYQLRFSKRSSSGPSVASIWYGDTPYQSHATVIDVGPAGASGMDVILPQGYFIGGTVTPARSPWGPVQRVTAYLFDPSTGRFERDSWSTRPFAAGDYTIGPLLPGDYLIRFHDEDWLDPVLDERLWHDAEGLFDAELVTIETADVTGIDMHMTSDGPLAVARLAGLDRIQTAIEISKAGFIDGAADVVYLANAFDYPDALSAGPAAAIHGGPLLLTGPSALASSVREEIIRLDPESIVIVGGSGVVGNGVLIAAAGIVGADNAIRVGGADRFETSRLIARFAFEDIGARDVFVATGHGFPDALAAGPAATYRSGPLILVDGSAAAIDPGTTVLLDDLDVRTVFIAGGTGVVSTGVEQSLRASPGVESVNRLAGISRYSTAEAINRAIFAYADSALLASGADFPDALAGGVLAGIIGSPLYLTPPHCLYEMAYWRWREAGGSLLVTLGGTGAVSEAAQFLATCPMSGPGAVN